MNSRTYKLPITSLHLRFALSQPMYDEATLPMYFYGIKHNSYWLDIFTLVWWGLGIIFDDPIVEEGIVVSPDGIFYLLSPSSSMLLKLCTVPRLDNRPSAQLINITRRCHWQGESVLMSSAMSVPGPKGRMKMFWYPMVGNWSIMK